jgi:septum formation protein
MSAARKALMKSAGIKVTCEAPPLDEEAAKQAFYSDTPDITAKDLALKLATAKALSLPQNVDRMIIAADQTLSLHGKQYDKAKDLAGLREKLTCLSGQTHKLHSAVACALNGEIVFEAQTDACLTMRGLSAAFLDDYISKTGQACLSSVGGYHYEGLGIQLFTQIEGDYHTILGLPLLPLLGYLRQKNLLAS